MTTILSRLLQAMVISLIGTTVGIASPSESLQVSHQDGEYVIPLGWLQGGSRTPIELRGADARRALTLPVSPRLRINEAKLELQYTNSISLIPRSQLAVTMDNRILAQLPLKADQPDQAVRIRIPTSNLSPGYHHLGFRAAQHYTIECEDPSAPELYTQVDAIESHLRIKAKRRIIKPTLARISDIFDNRLWLDNYTIQILLPPEAKPDHDILEAVSQVSQAIARTFEYRPVIVKTRELTTNLTDAAKSDAYFQNITLSDESWDGVLIGTRDQLAPFVSTDILNRIKEGYVGIFPSDDDPSRFILVISGTTSTDVVKAATVFNLPGIALPDREDVLVSELNLDRGYLRLQPDQQKDGWISFSQLGYRTTTMKGMYPNPVRLEFWSFLEMLDPSRQFVELRLNYAYGAGFDKKSALNIILNNQFVQALPFQDKAGSQVYGSKVRLPAVSLRPGVNELRFEPSVIGEDVGGRCQPIFTDNLRVTIFDDSRIELPPLSSFMRFPELGLFGKLGLPYTRLDDGQGMGVLVGDLTTETLDSAYTLIAKLSQVNKHPLSALRIVKEGDNLQNLDGLIVIASIGSLPEFIRREITTFLPGQHWQTIQVGTYTEADWASGLKHWVDQPLSPLVQHIKVNTPAIASLNLSEGLGDSAALIQFANSAGMPITVLMANDHEHLAKGVARLIEHSTWAELSGTGLLWSMDGKAIAKANTINYIIYGDTHPINKISYFLSSHPWQTALAAIAIITFIAWLTWWLLRSRAHKLEMGD